MSRLAGSLLESSNKHVISESRYHRNSNYFDIIERLKPKGQFPTSPCKTLLQYD